MEYSNNGMGNYPNDNKQNKEIKKREKEQKAKLKQQENERKKRIKMLEKQNKKEIKERAKEEKRNSAKNIERNRIKEQRKAEREQAKRERQQIKNAKRAMREQRIEERKKTHLASTPKRTYRTAFILSLAIFGSVSAAFMAAYFVNTPNNNGMYRVNLENIYQKSYYDLVESVNNIEMDMSKLLVTNTVSEQKILLDNLSKHTTLAMVNLSQLPVNYESINHTSKYINQLGDYCESLQNNISKGKKLTDSDKEQLSGLYNVGKTVNGKLKDMMFELDEDYFTSSLNNKNENYQGINDSFNELQNETIEYPTLIYDGPFSDSQENKPAQGLGENEIDRAQAAEKLAEILSDFDITDITSSGDTDGKIYTYNFTADCRGNNVFLQVSKLGGYTLLMDINRTVDELIINEDEAITGAQEMLEVMGYENMQSVWVSVYSNIYYINFTTVTDDGIVIYPEMIKVKIAGDDGQVLGIEAMSYAYNRKDRNIDEAKISQDEARQIISAGVNVNNGRLTVIPKNNGQEVLCYEFECDYDDMYYLIYINAETAEEENILRVIDSDSGRLLI